MVTIDFNLIQNSDLGTIEPNNSESRGILVTGVFRTQPLCLIIIGGTFITILLIAIISYRIHRSRYYYGCYDEEEDERLLSQNGFPGLKKTPTYYQWNRTPPSSSSSCCQKNASFTSPNSPEKKSWEQRRSVLLKKYAAIQQNENNENEE